MAVFLEFEADFQLPEETLWQTDQNHFEQQEGEARNKQQQAPVLTLFCMNPKNESINILVSVS